MRHILEETSLGDYPGDSSEKRVKMREKVTEGNTVVQPALGAIVIFLLGAPLFLSSSSGGLRIITFNNKDLRRGAFQEMQM